MLLLCVLVALWCMLRNSPHRSAWEERCFDYAQHDIVSSCSLCSSWWICLFDRSIAEWRNLKNDFLRKLYFGQAYNQRNIAKLAVLSRHQAIHCHHATLLSSVWCFHSGNMVCSDLKKKSTAKSQVMAWLRITKVITELITIIQIAEITAWSSCCR